jgi:hypothetical protein
MEAIRQPYAFVIRIDMPLETAKAILELLMTRKIVVDSFHMQMVAGGEAALIVHGRLERDRIRHIQRSLEKIDGVLWLDLLEGKGGNIRGAL